MKCSLSGGLASMGAAVPYAIAAKFAHPDRPVIALVGDGAMQMNNMAELITVSKYWREWSNSRFVVCVFNNEDLNQVTWEQRVMRRRPEVQCDSADPQCSLSPVRRTDRLARNLCGYPGSTAAGMGHGPGFRPAGGIGS